MAKKKWLTAGIDVGTTKVCTAIAQIDDNRIEVLGTGWTPSRGMRKGIVVSLSDTIESIRQSLAMAEKEAGCSVDSAFVSAGGPLLKSRNSSGRADVRGKNGEVSVDDVGRVIAEARRVEVPEDFQILHVLTQSFALDGQEGIVNPVGMRGKHLSVKLHIAMNSSAVVQNIVNAINKANVVVNAVVAQQLASAEAVLTEDEKAIGTVLADIGGGTTDLAIYEEGNTTFSAVLPIGGDLITKDIAVGLKAPLEKAEKIKIEMATVFPEEAPPEEYIELEEVGTGRHRNISRKLLCQIVQARCDELLRAMGDTILRSGVRTPLLTGVVLTGGGSLLEGLIARAEEVFELPVRLGYPINMASPGEALYHPAYATALGLLMYAKNREGDYVAEVARSAYEQTSKLNRDKVWSWLIEKIG